MKTGEGSRSDAARSSQMAGGMSGQRVVIGTTSIRQNPTLSQFQGTLAMTYLWAR